MFSFAELKEKINECLEWLKRELSTIRTGRATPVILDFIQVEAYNSRMNIKELANIIVEDSRTIKIEPWDQSIAKAIEKSINQANLGLSLTPSEKGLRVIFPELTQERRGEFQKLVKNKLEEARITLRQIRDKTWKAVEEKEKSGGIGEDQKFRLKEEMQKIVDDASDRLEEMAVRKEEEIKS